VAGKETERESVCEVRESVTDRETFCVGNQDS
jgi:hypothetical protein